MKKENLELDAISVLELTQNELEIIDGGLMPADHAGYWVSMLLGCPIHEIWLAGYYMGSNP